VVLGPLRGIRIHLRRKTLCDAMPCALEREVAIVKSQRNALYGGFTLAEVLIVVVIVAVLAAVAVPRFAQQREKAKTTEAIAIMTDIHKAELQYLDEHGYYCNDLGDDSSIKSVLGIDYPASHYGWSFAIEGGTVYGSSSHGSLLLYESGGWGGSGDYDPAGGNLWPDLPGGNFTGNFT